MKKMTLVKLIAVVTTVVALQLALVVTSMAAPPATGDAWGGGPCYTVQAGDTLSDIGYRYNIAPFFIAMVNHVSNPDWIYEGQVLCIPPVGPPFDHPAPGMGPVHPMPMPSPWPPMAVPYQGMDSQPEGMPYQGMDQQPYMGYPQMGMEQPMPYGQPQMGMDQSQGMAYPQMGMEQPMPYGQPQMGMDQQPYMGYPQMGMEQPMPYGQPQMGMDQQPYMGYPQMGMDQSQGMAYPQMGMEQPMPYGQPQMGMMPPQPAPYSQGNTY